jgi:hypothetical protein
MGIFRRIFFYAACVLCTFSLHGHDVFIQVRTLAETGEVRIRPFFDDGSDAIGDTVILADPETRKEIARYRIPETGFVLIPHPAQDLLLIYAGVPGHRAEIRLRGDPAAAALYVEQHAIARPESPSIEKTIPAVAVPESAAEGSSWLWLLMLLFIGMGGAITMHRRFNKCVED